MGHFSLAQPFTAGKRVANDHPARKSYEVFSDPPHKAFNYTLSRDNRWLYYSLQTAESDIWALSQNKLDQYRER